MMRLELPSGRPVPICAASGATAGATWDSVTETIVFTTGTGLAVVPAKGGTSRPLTTLEPGTRPGGHRSPVLLPGGKVAIYTVASAGDNPSTNGSIAAVDMVSGEPRVLVPDLRPAPFGVQYLPSGYLVYEQGGALKARAFNATTLQVSGSDVLIDQDGTIMMGTTMAQFALSDSGSLVHMRPRANSDLVLTWVTETGAEELSHFPPGSYYALPRLSPNSRQIAVVAAVRGSRWLQIGDVATGDLQPLAHQQGPVMIPAWRADGLSVTYTSTDVNRQTTLISRAVEGGAEQPLFTVTGGMGDGTWAHTPNGEVFAFANDGHTWIWSASSRSKNRLAGTLDSDGRLAFSPDRRWLAFVTNANGASEVWVRPYPEDGPPSGSQRVRAPVRSGRAPTQSSTRRATA